MSLRPAAKFLIFEIWTGLPTKKPIDSNWKVDSVEKQERNFQKSQLKIFQEKMADLEASVEMRTFLSNL